MRKSEIVATFTSDVNTVWNVVTNNEDYKWRSDIDHINILSDSDSFVEYSKGGFETKFIVTEKIECSRYEFRMENRMFTGDWTGLFFTTENGGTKIIFTENIQIINPIMELLSYLFMSLHKMQTIYVNDLKKKLNES